MNSVVAVVALLVAAIPFIAVGCMFTGIALLIAFMAFLETAKLKDIFFIFLATFDVVVLVAIWIAGKILAVADPSAWAQAQLALWVFIPVFLSPTAICAFFFYYRGRSRSSVSA